jgi:predicted nuclease of predicted toxin-antitoxin system
VKLLLDEMYPASVAIGLRKRGHDVIAVQEDENLSESDDASLFRIAQDMERAVVTENVKDFLPLDAMTNGAGRAHYGLIFTTNRSFPRHHRRFIGAITTALADYLERQRGRTAAASVVHWLRPPQPRSGRRSGR